MMARRLNNVTRINLFSLKLILIPKKKKNVANKVVMEVRELTCHLQKPISRCALPRLPSHFLEASSSDQFHSVSGFLGIHGALSDQSL